MKRDLRTLVVVGLGAVCLGAGPLPPTSKDSALGFEWIDVRLSLQRNSSWFSGAPLTEGQAARRLPGPRSNVFLAQASTFDLTAAHLISRGAEEEVFEQAGQDLVGQHLELRHVLSEAFFFGLVRRQLELRLEDCLLKPPPPEPAAKEGGAQARLNRLKKLRDQIEQKLSFSLAKNGRGMLTDDGLELLFQWPRERMRFKANFDWNGDLTCYWRHEF
jgi:hypothetical protein